MQMSKVRLWHPEVPNPCIFTPQEVRRASPPQELGLPPPPGLLKGPCDTLEHVSIVSHSPHVLIYYHRKQQFICFRYLFFSSHRHYQ